MPEQTAAALQQNPREPKLGIDGWDRVPDRGDNRAPERPVMPRCNHDEPNDLALPRRDPPGDRLSAFHAVFQVEQRSDRP
jgi:hypothetical protein